jgi:hypothetical protein
MEEIPLIYPNHAETPRRYVVDVDAKRLERSDSDPSFLGQEQQSSSSTSGANASAYLQSLDEALLGAASVSSVIHGGQELLVTTSALVEKPHIISVALSWKKHQEDVLDSPTIIELETKDLRVISIRAFASGGANQGIDLVLVGCRGTIVSFSLDGNLQADTETPLKVLHREDYIPTSLLEQVGPSDLQGNMVSFLPSKNDLIVLALAPLILTIDWKDTGTSSIWSETQCMEEMKARAAPFTGMITNLPSFILGKVDANVVDMAPTAALCVSTNKAKAYNSDEDVTAVLVFTLHSDASIRKWKIDPESSMSPIEVSTLEANKISNPSTWSDGIKSVSLCARFYDQTFALAVYIKTNTLSSYNEGVSDCNIWVFDGVGEADSTHDCMIMKVPRDAVSLVGMSFTPSQRRCTLSVVFEAVELSNAGDNSESEASGIKMINYPPSLLSIVSSEPDLVDTKNLDGIAKMELNRIRSLPYGSIVLTEVEEEAYGQEDRVTEEPFTVDQVLNKIDSLYMKHLFRPIFPRGNGTVLPPSETCIRRALSKLVHGAIKEHGMSVELETIKTLYEWRNRDKRKSAIGSPSKLSRTPDKISRRTTPSIETRDVNRSVYDSFVEPEEDLEREDIMIEDENDEFEQLEEEIVSEVESHESRWQRLLFQIWEEEQILRSPQCVTWLESLPVQILVRGSITTALMTSNDNGNTNDIGSWKATLQEASTNILELVEADKDKLNSLHGIEDQLTIHLSTAQLATSPQTSITEELTSLGRWARLQGKNSDDGKLRKLINRVPVEDLVAWIEDRPTDLGMFKKEDRRNHVSSDAKWSDQQVAKVQLRHASCSLAIRATDSIRRSRLSKCLLFLELAAGRQVTFAAFRAYVQSIAILWTSAQRIKMPDTAFQASTSIRKIRFEDDSPRNVSPPTKRSSFGDNTSSILVPSRTSMSTTLDVVMIKLSQDMVGSFNALSTPYSAITMLSGSFVDSIFASKETTVNGARRFMPELSVLPIPQDRERATDHPDLALRILSSFVAFQIPDDLPESVSARKEELSSCLLHAAQSKSFSAGRKSLMREMACDLLIPKNQDSISPVQKDYTKEGLVALKSIQTKSIFRSVQDLRNIMQNIIPNATSTEITRLCGLATARDLFSSYASIPDANLDDATHSHAVQIAKHMLRLSQILHRLNILEKYVTRSEGNEFGDDYNSDSLLQIISDAIADMETTFPEDFLKKMPEYISIWTKKFDHAVRACRWSQAYNACVKNPLDAHRETNFKRLVRAMVDSGALDVLLDMCTQLGMGSSVSLAAMDDESEEFESIDLYEIASGVLLTYADCDVYDSRSNSSYNTNLSDYQGALYALHASQEQWRRAAQSLDLRYVNAEKALRRATGKSGISIQTSELRDGMIIQDLVLSACGSANAIQLVKDPDYRFIVSGEYGKFSVIHSGNNSMMDTPNKLKRGRSNDDNTSTQESAGSVTRLTKFMVNDHLDCRAIRSVALRTLFFDTSTSYTFAKSAFRRGFDTSQTDVDELFKNGYYQYGLLLSKAWSKVFLNGQTKPSGEDLFGSCLSLLMGEYLVPLASSDDDIQRPTLQQLQISIDAASSSPSTTSYIVTKRSLSLASLEKAAVKAATFALIEKLTMIHSSAETPLALDVAVSFLEDERKLPVWLQRLLLGVEQNVSGGAFAPRTKADCKNYLGNPSALLKLYTHRGMFADACDVVTVILGDNDRATQAASRLPEKGNIDCVPYNSIDLLWNLIEIACSKGAYDYEEESRILEARQDMEQALQKHYECMQVSEMGMRSARMLNV